MMIPDSLQALSDVLRRLAAPAQEQIEYLAALGVADLADELALEFDDLYRPRVPQLEDASAGAAAACRDLDLMLSSDEVRWTFADLESAEWARIRAVAATALAALMRDQRARSSGLRLHQH